MKSITKLFTQAALITALTILSTANAWADSKTEGFESATTSTTYNSTATIATSSSDCGIAWSIYYGNVSTTSAITGEKSCLMRYYTASSSNLGYAKTTTAVTGLTNVTFNAKVTNTGNKMGVWYSTDGENWTELATEVTLTSSSQSKSYDIPNSSSSTSYYVKIGITSATTNKKDLIIDDVVFTYSTGGSTPTCATPTFSLEAGTYIGTQNVSISTSTDGATIYYTTDGTDPTSGSSVYSSAISVSTTTTIKAFAAKDGNNDSAVSSATYTILSLDHAGTEIDPYTVSDSRKAIDASTGITSVYATGIVSAIVTAYDSGNSNITFNIVDVEGDANYLQAYRCTGSEAENVLVGDVVVVSGNLTKYSSTYEFASGCVLVSLTHQPTITVSPASLSELSYAEGNGPSSAKSFTVSGSTLTANINLTASSDYEISLSESSGYTGSINLAQDAGTVASTTIYVRLKAGKSIGDYNDGSVTLTSTGATNKSVTLSGSVEAPNVTWNLGAASYASSSADLVSWTSSYATMTLAKGASGTSANNYLGGTNDHTRFYKDQILTVSPVLGYSVSSIVITAVSGNAAGFTGNDWTNASKSASGSIVTITPTDGTKAAYVTISAACRATQIKVFYAVDTTPTIVVSSTSINATDEETAGTLNVEYSYVDKSDPSDIDVVWFESDGTTPASEPSWITTDINASYNVDYIIAENTGVARTAYFKVYGLDSEADDVYSELVTVSQSAYVAPPSGDMYALFSGDLVEGDYIITYDGGAMNTTVTSDRLQYEDAQVYKGNAYTSDPTIVWHLAKNGDYWTIYNSSTDSYAASTGAANKAQLLADGTDDKSLWTASGSSTYEFINKYNASGSINANLRRNGSYGFASYSSGTGGALTLYKHEGDASIDLTATLSGGRYWVTFYNSAARYTLPAGAQAYTMNASKQLYLLGSDGSVIPANTAVVIIADSASITLTKSDSTTSVAVNGSSNILKGCNYPVAKSGISGTPYVLGIVGGTLGFYEYTGTNIPANKAYYIVTD